MSFLSILIVWYALKIRESVRLLILFVYILKQSNDQILSLQFHPTFKKQLENG